VWYPGRQARIEHDQSGLGCADPGKNILDKQPRVTSLERAEQRRWCVNDLQFLLPEFYTGCLKGEIKQTS